MKPLRILHLSDTHLYGDDASRHYGVVDTAAALDRVLERAATIEGIDLVVVSGDLSEDGSAAAYRRLRDRIEPFAARHGARTVYAMGNHDLREGFEEVLGARDGVLEASGWRVIRLDTSVPGAGYGELEPQQLAWLREQLVDDAEHGTIVVMHHPPVAGWAPLLQALELQHPDAALSVLADGDVRLILAGHYHHSVVDEAFGIPVVVAPGITNTSDAAPPAGRERAVVGSGFALIDLESGFPPRVSFFTAPSAEDGAVLFDLSPEEVAQIARQAGPPAQG